MVSKEQQKRSKGKSPPQYLLSGYMALDLVQAGCVVCGKILADLGRRTISSPLRHWVSTMSMS